MKIVIDISEEDYIRICDEPCTKLGIAVANGTPLPKNHGRLIDTNDLEDFCQTHEVSISAFDGELIYDAGSTSRGDTIWKPLLGELKPIIGAESEEENV